MEKISRFRIISLIKILMDENEKFIWAECLLRYKTSLTNAVLTHFLSRYSVLTIGAGRKVTKTHKKFAFHNHQSHTERRTSANSFPNFHLRTGARVTTARETQPTSSWKVNYCRQLDTTAAAPFLIGLEHKLCNLIGWKTVPPRWCPIVVNNSLFKKMWAVF